MDREQIYELMQKFEESQLAEIKIESEDLKITLKKPRVSHVNPVAPAAADAVTHEKVSAGNSTVDQDTEIIKSPLIGTFYRSPAADARPFVDEGSKIAKGEAVCIIEAMKIMNRLEADFPCEIIKILAENGQMVEYDAPLFEVKRIQS